MSDVGLHLKTMNYFTLIGLGALLFGLIADYKKDSGQHTMAKILHAICLTMLIGCYAGSFRILGTWIRNFDKVKERFTVDVGIVPGQLHFVFYLIHSALAMTTIVLAYRMISRHEKSRQWLIKLLPFLGLFEVFGFYRGWVADGDDLNLNHAVILFIGFLIVGGLTSFVIAIYKSRAMTVFFQTPKPVALTDKETSVNELH